MDPMPEQFTMPEGWILKDGRWVSPVIKQSQHLIHFKGKVSDWPIGRKITLPGGKAKVVNVSKYQDDGTAHITLEALTAETPAT